MQLQLWVHPQLPSVLPYPGYHWGTQLSKPGHCFSLMETGRQVLAIEMSQGAWDTEQRKFRSQISQQHTVNKTHSHFLCLLHLSARVKAELWVWVLQLWSIKHPDSASRYCLNCLSIHCSWLGQGSPHPIRPIQETQTHELWAAGGSAANPSSPTSTAANVRPLCHPPHLQGQVQQGSNQLGATAVHGGWCRELLVPEAEYIWDQAKSWS